MDHDPLLLLDNGTLAYILGDGDYRFTNIKFEEAKAIMEMKGTADIVRLFANPDLEHTMSEYLGIEKQEFTYDPEQELHVGQIFALPTVVIDSRPPFKYVFSLFFSLPLSQAWSIMHLFG